MVVAGGEYCQLRAAIEVLVPYASAERSEHRSVCGSVANAATELPLEHADLVAQHHQLDVLVQSCPSARSQQAEDPARER
jgi:hypothetical protein